MSSKKAPADFERFVTELMTTHGAVTINPHGNGFTLSTEDGGFVSTFAMRPPRRHPVTRRIARRFVAA